MSEWVLYANMMYNCNHVRKNTLINRLFFIESRLVVAKCFASSERSARRKFKLMGHDAGFLGDLI